MFTREFVVTFEAPMMDIEAWLVASPGTTDITPETNTTGELIYSVTPGGGAGFAEVKVNPQTQTVTIRTYWS